MGEFLVGVITGLCITIAFCFIDPDLQEDYAISRGLATYTSQLEDKETCERDLKRSEECIASILWLPEAR